MDEVSETGAVGTDTIDFSDASVDLVFTIDANATVEAAGTAGTLAKVGSIESLKGGTGRNTFRFLDGATLDGTITGARARTSSTTPRTRPR